MQSVKLQLNSTPQITRDMSIEMVNEVTGKTFRATPFLDGSVSLRDVDPGSYRLKLTHPNVLGPVIDKRIRVFDGRPTLVPVQIPTDLFQNTPIADTPDANLGPAQQKLADAADASDKQTKKRPGEPIFAEDWNAMAAAVSDVAQATSEALKLVSPQGHDHPELVDKINEIQTNLQKFYDVFAGTLVQLQRQIQQLALRRQVETALDDAQVTEPAKRNEVLATLDALDDVHSDASGVYTSTLRRVGETLAGQVDQISAGLPAGTPEPETVRQLAETTAFIANLAPVHTVESELQTLRKVDNQGGGTGLLLALGQKPAGR